MERTLKQRLIEHSNEGLWSTGALELREHWKKVEGAPEPRVRKHMNWG
jgi:hypothetical protein